MTATDTRSHACPFQAATITCTRCGCEAERERTESHPYSLYRWYFNGFCVDLNPHLKEDLFFAYCPDCKVFVSIHEAWEIIRAESARLKSLYTGKAT